MFHRAKVGNYLFIKRPGLSKAAPHHLIPLEKVLKLCKVDPLYR